MGPVCPEGGDCVTQNDTLTLVATPRDAAGNALTGRTATWSLSNAAVARISAGGVVTALAVGTATASVVVEGVTATVPISVTEPVAVLTVEPTQVSLEVGATQTLTATTRDGQEQVLAQPLPRRPVTWVSTNAAVAAVSASGVVTAVAAGEAVVRARVWRVGTLFLEAEASITVPVPVASVSLTPTTATVGVGATQALTATVRDAAGNALTGRTVTWTTSNAAVATVTDQGVVTGRAPGSATITATAAGRTATAAITVTLFTAAQFVTIQPGSFSMGSTNGRDDEQPERTVRLTRAFQLQATEVTQAQWQAVMGSNPSAFPTCGLTCPVENVSWDDVQGFRTRLNAQDPGKGYRLPTEAEWEYAARAGTTGNYAGTGVLADMGWYSGNSGNRTWPAGQKRANAWGLSDMHGNVWEWVQDWYGATQYRQEERDDPQGPTSGTFRVLRGGAWDSPATFARSAHRSSATPATRNRSNGFRLVRNP
jgi:formylglycine-generating enzyme required for sulfatase activity